MILCQVASSFPQYFYDTELLNRLVRDVQVVMETVGDMMELVNTVGSINASTAIDLIPHLQQQVELGTIDKLAKGYACSNLF